MDVNDDDGGKAVLVVNSEGKLWCGLVTRKLPMWYLQQHDKQQRVLHVYVLTRSLQECSSRCTTTALAVAHRQQGVEPNVTGELTKAQCIHALLLPKFRQPFTHYKVCLAASHATTKAALFRN